MKIYLTATSTLAKYSILYENLCQIFSKENAFEIIDVCNDADCVVSVGDITNEIIECKQKYKKAVVRFLFRSDISHYFYTDVTLVDHTFWLCDLDINILCPYQQTSEKMAVPFDFTLSENGRGDVANKFDIYVNTGEFLYADSALFKILRTLNRLTQLKIDVCSKNESIKHLTNANICITDSCNDIENHVRQAKIVIGSGFAVLFAIKHHKPFIVLGERGYGGIPTPNNIVQFYNEFFQGTIGGRLDGALPENLVYEDIVSIRNNMTIQDFSSALSQELQKNMVRLIGRINLVVAQNQNADFDNLVFNTDYTIINGNGKYWLLNRFSRFIIKKLSRQEVVILKTLLVSKTKMIAKSNEELEILLEFNRKKILKWEQKCSHNV